ncbi:MAG: hypothetical protein QG657_4495 [Acidobacteriota bacterium]|nr:hypothetical protein [Acidobacteriota bacterium]
MQWKLPLDFSRLSRFFHQGILAGFIRYFLVGAYFPVFPVGEERFFHIFQLGFDLEPGGCPGGACSEDEKWLG